MDSITKKCIKCGVEKKIHEFANKGLSSTCKICRREYDKKYVKDNRERVNSTARARYNNAKQRIYDLLGGTRCVRCGFDDPRALQIDHVDGCGNKNRIKNVENFYRKIQEVNGVGYQVLCANCNWIKREENNEHKKKN